MDSETNEPDQDDCFRILFGLETVRSKPNPPPVDRKLLEELLSHDEIELNRFELAKGFFEDYENWRDAFREMVSKQNFQKPSPPSGPSNHP